MQNLSENYTVPYLLSTYGPPDQAYVYLDTGIADMGLGIDLYLLHLDYSSQGWVAHLEMPLYRKGDLYLGCAVRSIYQFANSGHQTTQPEILN